MEAGHPFETKEMDEMRSRQRRLVREITDWIFGRATRDMAPLSESGLGRSGEYQMHPIDRELLEAEVRRFVDSELQQQPSLADLLSTLQRDGRTQPLSRFINMRRQLGYGFDEMGQRLSAESDARLTQMPSDLQPVLFALVQLLVLADELADDGYRDPRLT